MSETRSSLIPKDMVAEMIANWWEQCNTHAPSPDVTLTSTELEILTLLATGMTTAAIGRERHTSPRAVRKQLESIYTKFGLYDRLHCRRLRTRKRSHPKPAGHALSHTTSLT
jgi:DNA-binding NarL/FixJ family response regulator